LDDIIDIFSQPLKSQQELEQEDSSSDDESDAASLTSRSFGNHSDIEDLAINDPARVTPPPPEDEPLDPEANVIQVSKQIATLQLQTENEYKNPSNHVTKDPPSQESDLTKDPPPSSFVTPPQQFVFPAPVPPPQAQPLPAPVVPERRFNLNLMTPIEERTESSIFQHSADESTTNTIQSPLPSNYHAPRTPINRSFTPTLDSSPFEEYIPKMSKAKTFKKPILPAKPYSKPTHGPLINETTCNPMDPHIHQQIFDLIRPSLDTYEGFSNTSHKESKQVPEIERFIAKMSRKDSGTTTQHTEMRLQLGSHEYLIRKKLGQGAYAPVFLAEEVDTGGLFAIKVEKSPPRKWEFYLMRQAKRRLGVSRAGVSMIDAFGLHMFRDESFLILEYREQGTILDLVNSAKNVPLGESSTGVMDEVLAMFFTVELLRTVETLHSKQILHGDLKGDNCLVRFDPGDISSPYRRDGSDGWGTKGIALIDFGRGMDLKLFPDKVQFICEWDTDEQDCPEMRDARPWTYQVDYWGLAGIIHSMLWGKYITSRQEVMGVGNRKRYVLREGLKRYWQQELWRGLLEVLMNPTLQEGGGGLPITGKLKEWREKMEDWLEENSERGVGLRAIIRRIEGSGK
jgi:checkpoint serine/threonine-protein kinase